MISIVVSTYNQIEELKESLASIFNQTYKDYEVLIVDNLSTDGTMEYVKTITGKGIRYLRMEYHLGFCAVLNAGIEYSKGDYIAFICSGDLWHEEKLEKQLNYLLDTDSDVVFCKNRKFKQKEFIDFFPKDLKEGPITYEQLLKQNSINLQTVLGKKECFDCEKLNTDLQGFQDWELFIRLAKKYKVYYQDDLFADVQIQEESINPLVLFNSTSFFYNNYIKEYSNEIIDAYVEMFSKGFSDTMAEYDALYKEYQSILNSESWKITRPIRKILNMIKGKNS